MPTVVWDYDGTLHDSLHIYVPAVKSVFSELEGNGLVDRVPEEERIKEWIGLTKEEMWRRAAPHLDPEEQRTYGKMVGKRMQKLMDAGEARLYPGVKEELARFKELGWTQLMLTNAGTEYLHWHRIRFYLDHWIDGYYWPEGCGNRSKSELFKEIQEEHEGPWIMIGDRKQDMEAAKNNSALALGCQYGYASEGELEEADGLVCSVCETSEAAVQLLADRTERGVLMDDMDSDMADVAMV